MHNMDFIHIIILLFVLPTYTIHIFDEKADDLMDKYLVDVYTIRSRYNSPLQNPAPNFISETTLSPRKRPYRATKHPVKNARFNLTKSQFLENRQNEKVAAILKAENNPPPNFEIDELNVQSRRFDSIRKDSLKRKDEYLREIYWYYTKDDYGDKAKSRKNRTIRLMEQFIYETQYKLTYVQVLRKKYILQPRYRIGYCFSLLANLRNQQFVLFDALRRNREIWTTLYIHLKLYEKIVRLDVDIRDLIAYIKKLNWDRMPKEEPFYFDSVKHMQQ